MTVRELYNFLAEVMTEFPQVREYPVLVGDALARTITVDHRDARSPTLTIRPSATAPTYR